MFPNASGTEWLWTGMMVAGVIAASINMYITLERRLASVRESDSLAVSKAGLIYFVLKLIRTLSFLVIALIFSTFGVAGLITPEPELEPAQATGRAVFTILFFIAGSAITGYEILEIATRPVYDDAIDALNKEANDAQAAAEPWDGTERRTPPGGYSNDDTPN